MASSRNRSPRPRLTTSPSQSSAAPSPAVSTVHAAGYSSLAGDGGPSRSSSTLPAADHPLSRSPSTATLKGARDGTANDGGSMKSTKSKWFSRKGTWPRTSTKSLAITKVAQENASRESLNNASSSADENEHTELLQQSNVVEEAKPQLETSTASVKPPAVEPSKQPIAEPVVVPEPPATAQPAEAEITEPANSEESTKDIDTEPAPKPVASSWLGWWYGQPATENSTQENAPEIETSQKGAEEPAEEQSKEPQVAEVETQQVAPETTIKQDKDDTVPSLDGPTDTASRPRSWFGFLGGYQEPKPTTEDITAKQSETTAPAEETPEEPQEVPAAQSQEAETLLSQSQENVASKGYGWAFWSRERSNTQSSLASNAPKSESEAAVVDGPSKSVKTSDTASVSVPTKDARPVTASIAALREESRPPTPKPSAPKKADTEPSTAAPVPTAPTRSTNDTSSAKKKLQKILPPNHLLPAFDSCFKRPDPPSLLHQVTKIFKAPPKPPTSHLQLVRQPLRVKKAVAIGVHGFFPMRLVRTVLGEPTGTSIRFANQAASAIKRWADKNGIEIEVEKVALEGEGKVADRVDMLWKLLSKWMDHVRSADFVMMAAHSQGVVVGMQLLAKLIEEGCVENARVGFIGMAGINLGPFYHLPTTLLTGSARELFEFQKQQSSVSQRYIQALRTVLAHNVRIAYVGSIDDQLVPLESSTFSNISHPYIYRAVFVDGRVHAPDFLSHLVGFMLKLRNLGVSDHGLIRELSSPLAGSLYSGEGHSRIYDDGTVYDLGVRHALETADLEGAPLKVDSFELAQNSNPFFLPWSMRGLLEEPYVRTELAGECLQLLEQFDNWKPTSKVLKDVKFRLEGIRSKL